MSAYGNSDAIREAQIRMLSADMEKEYEAGNYVLCGGDFNHDLKASEKDAENCESWAYPFHAKSFRNTFHSAWTIFLTVKRMLSGTVHGMQIWNMYLV